MYTFLIMGLWILASTFIYHLSIVNESVSSHALYTILGLLPFAAGILITLPTLLFTIVNISIYSHKIATQIKLGLLSYLSNVSKTLLGTLIVCIPFSIYFFPNIILHMIGMFLAPLALPFLLLGWYLFSLNILDKTINEEHYPELVKKGVLGLENHHKEQ